MPLLLARDAMLKALYDTGESVLYRVMTYGYATGVDLIDYETAKATYDRGELSEPPPLP